LKPENLLLSDDSDDAEIKIADFGLSTASGGNTMLETFCGTLSYVAPEVLQSKGYHGKPVDMWAVGVITYILLCGYPPFYSEDDNEITELTLKGEFRFISPDWDHVSQDAKDFISALLILNPEERLTAKLALHHPWLTIDNDDEEAGQRLKDDETGSIMVENLRKLFNARNKFKVCFRIFIYINNF
jgi:serine/threonine protein kinase